MLLSLFTSCRRCWLAALWLGLAFTSHLGAAAATETAFDLPADQAETALRKFAAQSGVEVLFASEAVAQVRTATVKGKFAPEEALRRMLAATPLVARFDASSGMYLVRRSDTPPAPNVPAAPRAETAPARPAAISSTSSSSEETVALSPFIVATEQDRGYQAASTTAGSRLSMSLKETSAMIGVMTKDFMNDIAAVDISEIGSWGANVYFTGAEDASLQQQQLPNAIIRGIPGSFQSLARNYFITYTNVFPYNVERIEIPRGPNAALYGDAPLGGIINSNTKRARIGHKINQASVRADSEGSLHATWDANVSAGRRLAVRVNAMWEQREGWRDADFQRNRALHLAGTWQIAKNTTFRGEFEYGITKKSLPPLTYADQVALWDGATVYSAPRTANFAAATGTTSFATSTDYLVFDSGAPGQGLTNWRGFGRTTGTGLALLASEDYATELRPGLTRFPVVGDRAYTFNPHDMTWSLREATMVAGYLEHTFFDKLAVEIAYNYQLPQVRRTLGLFNTVSQDINTVRPDGTPNPHFGDTFADIEMTKDRTRNWVNDGRIMAAYPITWGVMTQRLIGLYGQRRDYYNQYRQSLTRVNGPDQRIRNAGNIVRVRRYLEDGNVTLGEPRALAAGDTALAAQLAATANEKGAIGDAVAPGAYDTRDTQAKGWELDLVFNPTKNWRGTVNFSLSDAFVSGAYTETRAYYDRYVNEWRSRAANSAVTDANGINTRLTTIESGFFNNADGRTLDRTPDYSARFFTTYRFPDGALRGLTVGGGAQFDGARVIGARQVWDPTTNTFTTPDPLASEKSASYYLVNAMFGYDLKLAGRRVRLQLNINNLLDEDDILFTGMSTYTRTSGGVTQGYVVPGSHRYQNPRSFVLTSTVSF